jgi:hypothetical protein
MSGGSRSSVPNMALSPFAPFAPAFTPSTFRRVRLLTIAALLTTGRRTVSNLLRTVASLAEGAPSSYHRVLSLARWSGLRLAALWTRLFLPRFWGEGIVSRRRQHCQRPSRQEGLRQGPPPRRGPLQLLLYYLALGSRAGRPSHAGRVFLCPPAWGSTPAGRPVPFQEDNRKRGRSPTRFGPIDVPAAASTVALVSRALLPLRRRCRLRQPRHGLLCRANRRPPAPGQHGLSSGQSVPTAVGGRQQAAQRPPAQKGSQVARATRGGGARTTPPAQRGLLRRDRRDVEVVGGTGHWYTGGAELVAVRWVYIHHLRGTHV